MKQPPVIEMAAQDDFAPRRLASVVAESLRRQIPELDPRVFVEPGRIVIRIAERALAGRRGRKFPLLCRIEAGDGSWQLHSELADGASDHGLLNKLRRLVEAGQG